MVDYSVTLMIEKFRNWRIVSAKDSEGVVRDCLLIPLDINGITQYKRRFCWNFYASNKISLRNKKYSHTLIPFIAPETREKMMEEGLVKPDDKYFSLIVGKMKPMNSNTWKKK